MCTHLSRFRYFILDKPPLLLQLKLPYLDFALHIHKYACVYMDMIATVELFKSLGESTRLRMVYLLAATNGKELCNCEFVDTLEEPQPNISRHLKILTQAGIVRERREGRWIYYRLAPDEPAVTAFGTLVRSFKAPCFREDMHRLRARLARRQAGKCVLGVQKTHLISGSPQRSPRNYVPKK